MWPVLHVQCADQLHYITLLYVKLITWGFCCHTVCAIITLPPSPHFSHILAPFHSRSVSLPRLFTPSPLFYRTVSISLIYRTPSLSLNYPYWLTGCNTPICLLTYPPLSCPPLPSLPPNLSHPLPHLSYSLPLSFIILSPSHLSAPLSYSLPLPPWSHSRFITPSPLFVILSPSLLFTCPLPHLSHISFSLLYCSPSLIRRSLPLLHLSCSLPHP